MQISQQQLQSALQHLSQSGATYSTTVLGCRYQLQQGKVGAKVGRDPDIQLHYQEKSYRIGTPADAVELDYFLAKGNGEGLDQKLARALRDGNFQSQASLIQAYHSLSRPDGKAILAQSKMFPTPTEVSRDEVLAAALYASSLGSPQDLRLPERAKSLQLLLKADQLPWRVTPSQLYTSDCKDNIQLGAYRTTVSMSLLDEPELVQTALANQVELAKRAPKFLVDELASRIWSPSFQRTQGLELVEQFQDNPRQLESLLHVTPRGQLPSLEKGHQVQQASLVADFNQRDWNWLTSGPSEQDFQSKLELLQAARKLEGDDTLWHNLGPHTCNELDGRPELLAYLEKLQGIHQLRLGSYQLAKEVPAEKQGLFEGFYQQVTSVGMDWGNQTCHFRHRDLQELWELGQTHSETYQKTKQTLEQAGIPAQAALLAALQLGPDISSTMQQLVKSVAATLVPQADSTRPFRDILRYAGSLEPEQQELFAQLYDDKTGLDWANTWKCLQKDKPSPYSSLPNDSKLDQDWLQVALCLRSQGQPVKGVQALRESGADPKIVASNLKETPEQRNSRAQRWLAYTTREANLSQARLSSQCREGERLMQKQKLEVQSHDHWYVPSQSYFQMEERHRLVNEFASQDFKYASDQTKQWDSRLAQLQTGQLPWGEPPTPPVDRSTDSIGCINY